MAADVCLVGGARGQVGAQVEAEILLVLAAHACPATACPVAVAIPVVEAAAAAVAAAASVAAVAAAAAAAAAAAPDVFPSAPALHEQSAPQLQSS